jgi:hypothetical protein
MTAPIQQTADTIRQRHDLIDAINANSETITVWSQADDGEWYARGFANEAAAAEYERKCRKAGVPCERRPEHIGAGQ